MNISYLSVNVTKIFENMDVRLKYILVNNYSVFVMGLYAAINKYCLAFAPVIRMEFKGHLLFFMKSEVNDRNLPYLYRNLCGPQKIVMFSHLLYGMYRKHLHRKRHIQCPVCENMYRISNEGFSPDINMMIFLTLDEVCKLILYKQPTYWSHQD